MAKGQPELFYLSVLLATPSQAKSSCSKFLYLLASHPHSWTHTHNQEGGNWSLISAQSTL